MPAVANDDFLYFFQTALIDEHAAYRSLADNFRSVRPESHNVAGFGHDDTVSDDSSHFHDLRMPVQLPVRSVNWNEVTRLHQGGDQLQFFFTGMAADVHGRLPAVGVIELRAAAIKVIHHASNCALVAGNMARGE